MPLDDGELLSRTIQHMQRACQDVRGATAELGTGKDGIARDRLRRTRLFAQRCDSKLAGIVNDINPALKYLKDQYMQVKSVFEQLSTEAARKERQTFRQAAEHDVERAAADYSRELFEEAAVVAPPPVAVDVSGLRTEEAIQREKLRGVREIETDVLDLKSAYDDFHALVMQQQGGIDTMADNVGDAQVLVTQGHEQIQSASRRQKNYRKFGCIIGVVLVVGSIVAIIAIITVVR